MRFTNQTQTGEDEEEEEEGLNEVYEHVNREFNQQGDTQEEEYDPTLYRVPFPTINSALDSHHIYSQSAPTATTESYLLNYSPDSFFVSADTETAKSPKEEEMDPLDNEYDSDTHSIITRDSVETNSSVSTITHMNTTRRKSEDAVAAAEPKMATVDQNDEIQQQTNKQESDDDSTVTYKTNSPDTTSSILLTPPISPLENNNDDTETQR